LDVENNILQILSAPGNILEDENAVDVLDNSKVNINKMKVILFVECNDNSFVLYYLDISQRNNPKTSGFGGNCCSS
jgi:hypothetical protein